MKKLSDILTEKVYGIPNLSLKKEGDIMRSCLDDVDEFNPILTFSNNEEYLYIKYITL